MNESKQQMTLRPLMQLGNKVEQQGLVVVNYVTNVPILGEFYISPYLIISLCERGTVETEYDMKPFVFHPHDFTIMQAGHVIKSIGFSDDYRVRLIVVSNDFLEKFKMRNVEHFNAHGKYYMSHPAYRLNNEQYRQMNQAFDLLETVSSIDGICREEMMLNIFHTIIMMRFEFSPIPDDVLESDKFNLSTRFHEAIARHYHESHNVDFYAHIFNMSPKYFTTLIKSEIGIGASECIDRYLTLQAKTLLTQRHHLTIQQIGYMLGFNEQTSFSRFFKQRTGIPPSEYRNRKDIHDKCS